MADRYVFSDEAGNFDFSRQGGASKYFILGTVTANDCQIGDRLLQLRRELGWQGMHLDRVFHATEDPQTVRDEVFKALNESDLRVDATILEKSKAQPHLRSESALRRSPNLPTDSSLPHPVSARRRSAAAFMRLSMKW